MVMKQLPDEFLFEEAAATLRLGKQVKLVVGGNSMLPFLHGGKDCVVLEPLRPEKLARGAVALFRHRGQYMLHRLIGKQGTSFRFCGDGNCGQVEIVSPEHILGILQCVERPSGRIIHCHSWQWRFWSEIWILLRPARKYLLVIFFYKFIY